MLILELQKCRLGESVNQQALQTRGREIINRYQKTTITRQATRGPPAQT